MKKCLILTSLIDGAGEIPHRFSEETDVICADAGLRYAKEFGLTPKYLIGDYDSGTKPASEDIPAGAQLTVLPCEKDMTDSEAAVDLACSKGYDHISVLGGLGGRFDHTMGNIGLLCKYAGTGVQLSFEDGQNKIFMLTPGTHTISKNRFKYLGLIAYNGPVSGLTVTGTRYTLSDHTLTADTTLGVSNEITGSTAEVSFTDGFLLVIQSSD